MLGADVLVILAVGECEGARDGLCVGVFEGAGDGGAVGASVGVIVGHSGSWQERLSASIGQRFPPHCCIVMTDRLLS